MTKSLETQTTVNLRSGDARSKGSQNKNTKKSPLQDIRAKETIFIIYVKEEL